jgi:hypothetical protein
MKRHYGKDRVARGAGNKMMVKGLRFIATGSKKSDESQQREFDDE